MSEYQYYEFQAVDRPLTREEIAALRALSTRASITATRFRNEYHFGDFKGNPLTLMKRYFDAHLYLANWGTRIIYLRLPAILLDRQTALRYCFTEGAEVHTTAQHMILEFRSEDEEGADWIEGGPEDETENWLGMILPVRAELASGDLRALYISWLSCAGGGLLDDDDQEPPVPPGLGTLSTALQRLSEFLRVDNDLITVAAARSASQSQTSDNGAELSRWVAALPVAEKDAALMRLLKGEAPHLRAELLRVFNAARRAESVESDEEARTVGELLLAARHRAAERRREEALREEKARERREREAVVARERYLDGLVSRQETAWQKIEALLEERRGKAYDEATQLLIDLREVSERTGTLTSYRDRVRQIYQEHPKQPAFLARFTRADLLR